MYIHTHTHTHTLTYTEMVNFGESNKMINISGSSSLNKEQNITTKLVLSL